MGAIAIHKGAKKERVRDEKSRNNRIDLQKTEKDIRLLFPETSTPRIMDMTKKKTVNSRGIRNIFRERGSFSSVWPWPFRVLRSYGMGRNSKPVPSPGCGEPSF